MRCLALILIAFTIPIPTWGEELIQLRAIIRGESYAPEAFYDEFGRAVPHCSSHITDYVHEVIHLDVNGNPVGHTIYTFVSQEDENERERNGKDPSYLFNMCERTSRCENTATEEYGGWYQAWPVEQDLCIQRVRSLCVDEDNNVHGCPPWNAYWLHLQAKDSFDFEEQQIRSTYATCVSYYAAGDTVPRAQCMKAQRAALGDLQDRIDIQHMQ